MAEFRIKQGGITVAGANSEDLIFYYAMQYRQEGDLTIQVKHILPSGPSWKRHMFMAKFPQPTILELESEQ